MKNLRHVGMCVLALNLIQPAWAAESVEKSKKVLGRQLSAAQNLSATPDGTPADAISDSGVQSTTNIKIFGKNIEVVKSSLQYKVSEGEGLSYDNKFYVNGRKVLAENLIDGDGVLSYSVDVPANEIKADLFNYSLGILTVGVNGGLTYEGHLKAEVQSEFLKPNPVITPDMNLVMAKAEVDVMAKGFIEGQAKVLFLKAAVGGELNLIDGNASASISVGAGNITKPVLAYDGMVNLMSGSFYGSVGTSSKPWWKYDFFKSNGVCYAFGAQTCPVI